MAKLFTGSEVESDFLVWLVSIGLSVKSCPDVAPGELEAE
jgi:hypothetical protein